MPDRYQRDARSGPIRSRTHATQHLPTLDFLRGVAAFCVVLFHFSSRVNLSGLFYHGYLAVDFFFCLSGYVLSRAYRTKLGSGQMPITSFVKARLIRFLPLVILGNLICALFDFFRPGNFSISEHIRDIIFVFAVSSFLLPVFWKTTLEQTTYPLNGPVWSLFFELSANVIYAAVIKTKHYTLIVFFIVISSFFIILFLSHDRGNIHFGPHASDFLAGFPRVCLSFFLGALLEQKSLPQNSLSKWGYAILLTTIVAIPDFHEVQLDYLYDLISICVIFPAIVAGSAHCHDNARKSALSDFSGEMSFPIYCLHYPFVRVIAAFMRSSGANSVVNLVLSTLFALSFAFFSRSIFVNYDKPVRKWLTRNSNEARLKISGLLRR